jgi:hypothetical protein
MKCENFSVKLFAFRHIQIRQVCFVIKYKKPVKEISFWKIETSFF